MSCPKWLKNKSYAPYRSRKNIAAADQADKAFARSICCRARNTVRAPAFKSADTVQSRNHIKRIDAERGPEGELAEPMLFRVTSGAQRNGVAIARFHPDTTIGSGAHMCGL